MGLSIDFVNVPVSFLVPKNIVGLGDLGDNLFKLRIKALATGDTHISILRSDYIAIRENIAKSRRNDYTIDRTAYLNKVGIGLEKDGDIDGAISVYEENIKIRRSASHAYDRLLVLYRKRGDVENEKRVLEIAISIFGSDKYKSRLSKLDGSFVKNETVFPLRSNLFVPDGETLGAAFQKTILLLPEFNFYCDIPAGYSSSDYLWKNRQKVNDGIYKPVIWKIQSKFKSMLSSASEYEKSGRLDEAAKKYEEVVAHEYYMTLPYDRLIKIYSRSKLFIAEKNLLVYSIRFFSELKEKQKAYVLYLAEKYDKLEYVRGRIDNDEKIFYYGGSFELYSPFNILLAWNKRLSILTEKTY